MSNNVDNYIKNWFIELEVENLPLSFYIIRKTLLSAVSELKPKLKGVIVDLGCGVMPYKQFLKSEHIDRYIGIDLELTEYHEVKPDLFWDGNKIPLEDSSTDFLIATEFLEHYYDTLHILKEVKRVLKPGGTFFFTVPNVWPLHEVPYDYHRFTPFFLEKKIKESGFQSCSIKKLGGFHCHLALSIALWNDYKLSPQKKRILKPFLKYIVNVLMKKDIKEFGFKNDQMYSGLYGFAVK